MRINTITRANQSKISTRKGKRVRNHREAKMLIIFGGF